MSAQRAKVVKIGEPRQELTVLHTDPTEVEIAHLAESTVESIVKALPRVSILKKRTPDDV